MKALVAVCAALLISACATIAPDPAGEAQPATVTLFAATTRGPSAEPGELFGGEHQPRLAFAHHVIAAPGGRPLGAVVMTRREAEARDGEHFRILSTRASLGDKDLSAYVAAARRRNAVSIMFVHGFNNTYREALYRVSQAVADVKIKEAPILFSFASRGDPLAYPDDRRAAELAAPQLASFIEQVSAMAGGRLDVGAHSMGGWMTMLALKSIAERRGPIAKPLLRGLIFASPDIDADELQAAWPRIRPLAKDVVLVCHEGDIALRLSMRIAGLGRRAGNIEDCAREAPKRFPGVTVVDAAADDSRTLDRLKHNPATNPALIAQFARELLIRR